MIVKKIIDIPIYPGKFIIAFYDNVDELAKHLKLSDETRQEMRDEYGTTLYGSWKGIKATYVLYLIEKDALPTHNAIAHEIYHAASRVFQYISAKEDQDNPEPFAYFIGWLTEQVYKLADKGNITLHH